MMRDNSIVRPEPSISPAVSLATSDSSVSCYYDQPTDAPLNDRPFKDESSIENFSLPRHQPSQENGSFKSDSLENNLVEISNVKGGCAIGESEIAETTSIHRGDDNETDALHSSNDDSHVWFPPEPEDEEADIEDSVANYEDDDDDEEEGEDGMKWGKPSNLSSLEGSGSFKFREEKRKAMDQVMSGKFKTLVEHLLKSMGISCLGSNGDTWVDIVTSLSWEAASFLKPDAFEGKAMDPDGYVKVKCIATGDRSQSEVFKGLVFKKHAAHKHMPTKFKKPKLLLIKGSLSVSSDGLSSFESMKQDEDRLESVISMIEKCHPNVVLVEKTVSRDIQESILAKGMTLVLEMKLHRLQRVARCTGSPILSSDKLNGQKLRQCDSFYFEKIVEEHGAVCENGKRPRKTLMFLEGCPKRMGCTILLKGSQSEELKKIKTVVQFAVVMAYHLILESSFILNQRAMFSTIAPSEVAMFSTITPNEEISPSISNQSNAESDLIDTVDIPISNAFYEEGSENMKLGVDSLSSFEPYNPLFLSGLSSLPASLKQVVGFPHFNNGMNHHNQTEASVQVLSSPDALDTYDIDTKVGSDDEKTLDNEQIHSSSSGEVSLEETKSTEEQIQSKDNISAVLESESILVLMSRRNAARGIICEQSRFSCIKFYRNFDIPLGKFLQDNLLNQKLLCGTCDESPEAHAYYYAHHDKQLTIQMKRLPVDRHLPGENEGKLWMWSCCGKCKPGNGKFKTTKRVLITTAARGLSFGKFLELGFSNHSSCDLPSICGHSFYRDYFHFFGLGSMVAMFRYSPVSTYSVSLTHLKVEFGKSIGGDFLKKEVEDVYGEGLSMFAEVETSLRKMEVKFVGSMLNLQGSIKTFSDVEEMLRRERNQFEVEMKNTTAMGDMDDISGNKWMYRPLHLNHVQWDLLLESCIWDQRLHSLLSSDLKVVDPEKQQFHSNGIGINEHEPEGPLVQSGEEISDNISEERNSLQFKDIPIEGDESSSHSQPGEENGVEESLTLSSQMGVNGMVQMNKDLGKRTISDVKGKFSFSLSTKLADPKGWMWTPFRQIQSIYMNDLERGYFPNFEPINSYTAGSKIHKMITEEGSKLHFPLGTGNLIVSDYEEELSSIIACALAFLKEQRFSSENVNDDGKSYETSHMTPSLSLTSSRWSSFGSLDSDVSSHVIPSEESHFSSFDGLELLDSVASSRHHHPVVSMGRLASKAKYTVACLYANEFLDLRSQCDLSEMDYIASLSRCKHFDAKGGKSKSFFAKTLDDRFIIKEIKKTEFYSFLEFASDYFKHMNECFMLGNQTCLAKILGIYEVKKRGAKHDLMVMENVTYSRIITRQYDLKGALHARFNSSVDGAGDVLLDQNFVNDMNVSPLYVNRRAKRNLQRAVWNDTAFLNSINVMDYSLLVGVDAERRELVCGIIDYVRQYTWDKQLENWVKSFVVPKNHLPTVVSPKEYKKRFRKFIDTHFLSVPDDWCSQRSSNRCSLCGMGANSKSQEQYDEGKDDSSHGTSAHVL